jgi:glycerate-2-kinase
LKSHSRRREAADIFRAALSAVDPYELIRLRMDQIRQTYHDGACDRMFLVSFGKAAGPMTRAVSDFAGDLLTKGIMITKYGHVQQADAIRKIVICEAAHPVPDVQGVLATEKAMDLLREADRRTLVVCLVSGGGSALLVAPQKEITLAQKQQITQLLLKAGADIRELNTVRKHISRIKGGRLAELACPAGILSLILSDVIDDPLDVIASGPTSPDQTTFQDALDVIGRYGLTQKIPEGALNILKRGAAGEIPETPKEENPAFARVENIIVGSNRKAIESARTEAVRKGYGTTILSSTLQGEAGQVGKWLAQEAIAARRRITGSPQGRICLISGGETTVTVRGRGLGGRNMELALAFAQEIKEASGITLLSAGTDGTDGPTDAAGAFADAATLLKAAEMGLAPDAFLQNNDTYHFFKALGGLFVTGPTGTNVMDLQIVLIGGGD